MTTIRTTCPQDGEVDLTAPDVEIAADELSYTFMCPRCGEAINKRANDNIVALLRTAGVLTESVAPVITNRDILMFSNIIDQELEELLRTEGT